MPHTRFMRFRYLLILASVLLAVGVMMPGISFAKSWSIVPSPNQSSNNDYLSAVAAVSANNIWTVGSYFTSSGVPQTLIEQWNGTSWNIVASPNQQGSIEDYLNGVAAVPGNANDIWAVGHYVDSSYYAHTLIEQWNGTSWSIVPGPDKGSNGSNLYGVVAVSANNVWAVGDYSTSTGADQTLIEHWNGTSWSIVTSPNVNSNFNALSSVAAVSANNIWAVGYYQSSRPSADQTLIEQWNGTSWSIIASPNQGTRSNVLNGVAAGSASNIWAVGDYINSSTGTDQTLIEHWNGTSWNIVASPNVNSNYYNYLYSVAAVSANNIWAVGNYLNGKGSHFTLIEHWNGTSWSIVPSPNVGTIDSVLSGVARVPGSSNVWAVGYDAPVSIAATETLTEYYG